jgi:hypothetical protein
MRACGSNQIVHDENWQKTYVDIPNSAQVLLDTLAVKDVVALGLDGVFGHVVAEPADGGFTELVAAEEFVSISLAAEDKIGVASHLAHTSEPARKGVVVSRDIFVEYAYTHKLKMLE